MAVVHSYVAHKAGKGKVRQNILLLYLIYSCLSKFDPLEKVPLFLFRSSRINKGTGTLWVLGSKFQTDRRNSKKS